MDTYKLVGRDPIKCSLTEWCQAMQDAGLCEVAQFKQGNVLVSTVFLGLDHNHARIGPPVLFETRIFGGMYNGYMRRYATYAAAVKGHNETVDMMRLPANVGNQKSRPGPKVT